MARRKRAGQDADDTALSRRRFLGVTTAVAAGVCLTTENWAAAEPAGPLIQAKTEINEPSEVSGAGLDPHSFWWRQYPSFAQMGDAETFRKTEARTVIHGSASDPTWGPFGQITTRIENAETLKAVKAQGGRAITWIEGFGDCMLFAAAFQRNTDGSFQNRTEAGYTDVPYVVRSHWSWADPNAQKGNALRWVGIHNLVDNEDFVQPLLKRIGPISQPPTYPDGRLALGLIPGGRYPVNHRVYDACGSKDLNGSNFINPEYTAKVNDFDKVTGKPAGPLDGLFAATAGKDDIAPLPGQKAGDTIYCGAISIHKDLSAPFWRQYVRRSMKQIVAAGLDGIWCDNYSPWDNFGYPPVQKAFGDWSVEGFHQFLTERAAKVGAAHYGLPDLVGFDVRKYVKARALEFGAKDSSDLTDVAWKDRRWIEDKIWNAFKASRQLGAQRDLAEFYHAIHDEANAGGRPDFCIGGNDVPLYGLGWVRDTWQDMINTETTPGWHMGAGSRGIMIPPFGKMAIMYRAALEHQKGPFSAAWYYLNGPHEKHQQKPEIGKLLVAEAFANGAFLLCMPDNKQVCGTLESHAWWNGFVKENEGKFGRREPFAEVGVLFSPDNQLAQMTPGGYPDIDDQPHFFGHHGWATACIDAHYPYRALTDWKLTSAHLATLKTLVLPHAASLSDVAIETISKWTREGGRLVLTGRAGSHREPAKEFAPRERNTLADALGLKSPGELRVIAKVGKGVVSWTLDNPGSEYYLQHMHRTDLLPIMAAQLGENNLVRVENLPSTVGLFLWRSHDHKDLFVDLVNYDLDADRDLITPAANSAFRIRTGSDSKSTSLRAETITPDSTPLAVVTPDNGWALVRIPRLEHFASVKISL